MEVIAKDCKDHPSCPHGPCLMFERKSANGTKTGKKFYACSACRDRSVCSFFHWVDDKISNQKKKHWELLIKQSRPLLANKECKKRLAILKNIPVSERTYCKTCSIFIFPEEKGRHKDHEMILRVTDQQLQRPSELFQSLENNKAEAQYFFSEKTTHFVVNLLDKLGFTKLLLIGAPKIHELINAKDKHPNISSLLLDIDQRYMQFFSPEQFCRYNLFNNHFFDGEKCEEQVKQFLSEEDGGKVAILIDPPFGGLVDAISLSLQMLDNWWKTVNSKEDTEAVPLLWFFPYFLEPRINKNVPGLKMMDYKVEYLNHKKFAKDKSAKGSPVRIFTNISPKLFILPAKEGYKYCKPCQRFVSAENSHCKECKSCTTKHGSTYKHCNECKRCVKSSWEHCDVHNKCSKMPTMYDPSEDSKRICACILNQDQQNENEHEKCFKCDGFGHKRRYCPTIQKNKKKKKQRTHVMQ